MSQSCFTCDRHRTNFYRGGCNLMSDKEIEQYERQQANRCLYYKNEKLGIDIESEVKGTF